MYMFLVADKYMIKTPVALFPFSLEMLGLVRNFNQLQEKYLLTKVIASTGCGVIHKDAGYIANQTNTGYIVSDTLYEENDIWEILLITETFKEEKTTYSQKLEYINLALKMNKKVICFTQGYSNILRDTEEIAAKYRNNFTIISSEHLFNKENLLLKQSAIQIPIILVGGLLMEADVTEVVYELTETLKNKNFNVMPYTNNIVNTIWNAKTLTPIFLNKTITESEKISSIKSVIKRDIYKERPDVIIIEAA